MIVVETKHESSKIDDDHERNSGLWDIFQHWDDTVQSLNRAPPEVAVIKHAAMNLKSN